MTPNSPRLDPTDLDDPDRLAAAIEQLLLFDPDWQATTARIRTAQEQLRAVVDDEAWQAYLIVAEATNLRLARALDVVARWAFEQAPTDGTPR